MKALITFIILAIICSVFIAYIDDENKMRDVAFSWCGLSKVEIIKDNGIESSGTIFTSCIEWSFVVPREKITDWIAGSSGLKNAKDIKKYSEIHKLFIVNTCNGAAYGEVEIWYDTGEVRIKTYWS